jgi:hypothetical protein
MKYPANPLTSFDNGCLMDLRARMAINLLTSPAGGEIVNNLTNTLFANWAARDTNLTDAEMTGPIGELTAKMVFAICENFMAEGERRGLIQPLPDENEPLSEELQAHLARHAYAQFLGSKMLQDIAQAHAPKVARPAGLN